MFDIYTINSIVGMILGYIFCCVFPLSERVANRVKPITGFSVVCYVLYGASHVL